MCNRLCTALYGDYGLDDDFYQRFDIDLRGPRDCISGAHSTPPPAIRDTLGFKNKRTYEDFPCRIQGTLCGSQNKLASYSHLTVNGKTGRLKLHCSTAGPA